jgi:hypothetical protein
MKELDNQPVYLGGSFLLDRMANTRQKNFLPEVWNARFHALHQRPPDLVYPGIVCATNEQCRLLQLAAGQERSCLPVNVLCAIPVQCPAETRAREFLRVVIQVLRLQPRRQLFRLLTAIQRRFVHAKGITRPVLRRNQTRR